MTHHNGTGKAMPEDVDLRDIEGAPVHITADPRPSTGGHHEHSRSEFPKVTEIVARTATLNSRWHALNWACGPPPCLRHAFALYLL